MPTRLRSAIALLTLFAGVAALGSWSPGDEADASALEHCISHAFPTAEAGFALQRPAAERR